MNTNTLHYISHLHMVNLYMLLLYCRTQLYPHQAQIFTWWWDKVTVFLFTENTQSQRFCPGEGRCKFLHKYKISSGGGGINGNK